MQRLRWRRQPVRLSGAEAEDKFRGDRLGTVIDPFGHTWHISTHIEVISDEEMKRRMAAMLDNPQSRISWRIL
jgi:hypothetical protein